MDIQMQKNVDIEKRRYIIYYYFITISFITQFITNTRIIKNSLQICLAQTWLQFRSQK